MHRELEKSIISLFAGRGDEESETAKKTSKTKKSKNNTSKILKYDESAAHKQRVDSCCQMTTPHCPFYSWRGHLKTF
jgi:hypothetical protein